MSPNNPIHRVGKKGKASINPKIMRISKHSEANRHHDAWQNKRDRDKCSNHPLTQK
jgi:hypothetical protein